MMYRIRVGLGCAGVGGVGQQGDLGTAARMLRHMGFRVAVCGACHQGRPDSPSITTTTTTTTALAKITRYCPVQVSWR
ncbi:hypothetical protein E2C01_005486 [Portunus trituberculatus]|uniref:Uncharacterized protein n=1 Tax=Portunus trituberculatus TaxID=210409 RepID=A0A5B7CTP2_PORTR|nr:hypothetical protein [Portunus trituberculatus]